MTAMRAATIEGRLLEQADHELGRSLEKIEACVQKLDEAELWWRPHEGANSVANLLLHLTGNLSQWVLATLGGRAYERGDSKAELLRRLADVIGDSRKVLRSLTASDLLAPLTIQGEDTDGLAAVLHVVEHLGYHTGQIVLVTKQLAGQRTEIDFYPHLRGQ
jgi:uncharacterized damage-inducible protein DinB